VLNQVATGVWDATQPLKVAGFELGHRMTVVRFGSGEIAVHSPIKLSSAVVNDIKALGPAKYILAPSAMHDLYLGEWMQAFPDAALFHSPALKLKGVDVRRAKPLTREAIGELEPIPVEGMPKIQESVFLHRPSRSLIVCDLVFNLPPGRGFQKLLQKLNGIYERLGPSKLFKACITHDEAFRSSMQEILALEFDRLIVGHGANVNAGAREHFCRAFEWLRLSISQPT
jgi:hypothetical protein